MVTVIIPTYKRAAFIDRAIESVLNQTYKDIELIVVDDNDSLSEDRKNMEKIMKKYDKNKNVIYMKHKENMNGASARNTGISIAKGDYITFLDDDDFFVENRIEKMVTILEKNKEYDCAYSGVIKVNKGKITDVFQTVGNGNFKDEMLMQNSFFKTGSNMFFRANILKQLNGFDTSFLRHQDIEIMVRFFRKSKIIEIKENLVVKDDSSRINMSNIDKMISMREHFLKTFEDDIKNSEKRDLIYRLNYQKLLNYLPSEDERKNLVISYANDKGIFNLEQRRKRKNRFLLDKLKIIRGIMKKYVYLTKSERKSVEYYIKKYNCE